MVEYLNKKETVLSWVGLSLAERAVMLHRQFPNVRIGSHCLGMYYKSSKIRKKPVVIKKIMTRYKQQ